MGRAYLAWFPMKRTYATSDGEGFMTNPMSTNNLNEMGHLAKRLFARCWWVAVVLLFASFASIHAQQTTGSIVGTVKDKTGAVVNTATAKATNVDTGYSRVSP